MDRTYHSTLNSYNWSSRPPKVVISDILESLGKELQLSYYYQYMIPCWNEPNNTIIQICPEDMQKPNRKFLKSITLKPSGLKSWNFRKSNIRKLSTIFVFTIFIENIIWSTKLSWQQKMHMQPFQNVTIWCFTCFANKEHAHMSHSRTSTTTNILRNTLLNTNCSKNHQIQLQALSMIMLLLILSPNKHIYNFSDIWEQLVWGWDFYER